ncbi:Protein CBG27000 [Caenorhabditis briggsae]|uniref:Protein CBG27000 n=2 Tax=Rhabditomorpha TaxID=2301119 RepID=B6IIF7_CAEBR|nr:Protein CBG27000 [Caenorhabditis briggsae]CAR99687.1 Protein CBG27000 [Caenorhabditis briggsae]
MVRRKNLPIEYS